jgi:hypothetical protein
LVKEGSAAFHPQFGFREPIFQIVGDMNPGLVQFQQPDVRRPVVLGSRAIQSGCLVSNVTFST